MYKMLLSFTFHLNLGSSDFVSLDAGAPLCIGGEAGRDIFGSVLDNIVIGNCYRKAINISK